MNVSFTATPFYQGDTGTINNNSGSQNNNVGNGSSGKNELCSGQTDKADEYAGDYIYRINDDGSVTIIK